MNFPEADAAAPPRRIVATNIRPPQGLDEPDDAPPQGPVCIDPECFADLDDGETIEERTQSIVEHNMRVFRSYRDSEQRKVIEQWWMWVWKCYWGYKYTHLPENEQYVIREGFKQMETWKANVYDLLFGGEQFCTYKPRFEGFDPEAEGSTAVVNDQIKRFGSDVQLRFLIELMGMFGKAYMHPQWRFFTKTAHKLDLMHADFAKDTWDRETNELTQNGPYVEVLSPEDVYAHPNAERVEDSPAVFVYRRVSAAELKTEVREGRLDAGAVMDALEQNSGDSPTHASAVRPELRGVWDERRFHELVSEHKEYEFLLCQSNGWEYAILQERFLLRAAKIPGGKIELRDLTNYPQKKMHYGVPELMLILEDIRLMNDLTWMYVHSHIIGSNPMFLVQAEAKKYFDQSEFGKPGGKIVVDNMTDVAPIQTVQTSMLLEGAINWVRSNAQIATGMNDQVAGNTGNEDKTATEFAGLRSAATTRIKYKAVCCGPALEGLFRDLYDLNAMYCSDDYKLRITGPDGKNAFKSYPPTVFAQNGDNPNDPRSGSSADIDVELILGGGEDDNKARSWIQILQIVPALSVPVNIQPILDRVFRAMGEKNVRVFRASSKNAQGDALAQVAGLMATGVMPEAKPGDEHPTFVQIFQMALKDPSLPPPLAMILSGRLAEHMTFMQEAQQAQQQQQRQMQMQMAMHSPSAPKRQLPAPQRQANERTEARFGNAQRGAMQNGKMP